MKRLVFALVLLAACSPEAPQKAPVLPKSDEKAAPVPKPDGKELISFEPPSGWVREEPTNRLRLAQFRVPDKQKQAKDAECTLSHFANRSVDVDGTVAMWSTQM